MHMKKRVVIVGLSVAVPLMVGLATLNKEETMNKTPTNSTKIDTPVTEAKTTPSTVTPAEQPTAVAPEIAATPAPTPDPVVRSSEAIILDYANLSGDDELLKCTRMIIAQFPQRFMENNREVNIKLLSDRFASSRSALLPVPDNTHFEYLRDNGQGDFWQRSGGL